MWGHVLKVWAERGVCCGKIEHVQVEWSGRAAAPLALLLGAVWEERPLCQTTQAPSRRPYHNIPTLLVSCRMTLERLASTRPSSSASSVCERSV